GDRDLAYTALLERLTESRYATVSLADVLAAERAVVSDRFGGSRGAYLAAIAQAHTTLTVARGVIADQLRRLAIEPTVPAASPPLGALPLARARTAIAAALKSFARGQAFETWTVARQSGSLQAATCLKDDLPQPGAVDLSTFLPFLSLTG